MTYTEMIRVVADQHGMTQVNARAVLGTFIEAIRQEVKDSGRIHLPGLGVFTLRDRAGRRSCLPGAEFQVEPYKTVHFQPAAGLKRWVNLK